MKNFKIKREESSSLDLSLDSDLHALQFPVLSGYYRPSAFHPTTAEGGYHIWCQPAARSKTSCCKFAVRANTKQVNRALIDGEFMKTATQLRWEHRNRVKEKRQKPREIWGTERIEGSERRELAARGGGVKKSGYLEIFRLCPVDSIPLSLACTCCA